MGNFFNTLVALSFSVDVPPWAASIISFCVHSPVQITVAHAAPATTFRTPKSRSFFVVAPHQTTIAPSAPHFSVQRAHFFSAFFAISPVLPPSRLVSTAPSTAASNHLIPAIVAIHAFFHLIAVTAAVPV